MDIKAGSESFVKRYFKTFDDVEARNGLARLYRAESTLLWEGSQYTGSQDIISALTRPSLMGIKTKIMSIDATPSPNECVLVAVSGALGVDDSSEPLNFAMTFSLQPAPGHSSGFFIHSHIFRLVYGDS